MPRGGDVCELVYFCVRAASAARRPCKRASSIEVRAAESTRSRRVPRESIYCSSESAGPYDIARIASAHSASASRGAIKSLSAAASRQRKRILARPCTAPTAAARASRSMDSPRVGNTTSTFTSCMAFCYARSKKRNSVPPAPLSANDSSVSASIAAPSPSASFCPLSVTSPRATCTHPNRPAARGWRRVRPASTPRRKHERPDE